MKFEIFPFNTREHYFSADVLALYQGQWLFCMHKNRTTLGTPRRLDRKRRDTVGGGQTGIV